MSPVFFPTPLEVAVFPALFNYDLHNPLSFAVSAPAIGCGNLLEGNITRISTLTAMSHRPKFQGGRRGGSGGRSGGRGGGRGAGLGSVGEQIWWDPAWRDESLRQIAAEKVRGELDKLLRRKIEEPGLDIVVEGTGVVAAVRL